jgi:hypothetical protein
MVLPWRVKTFDGATWDDAEVRKWTGGEWLAINGYYWDGDSWEILTDRTPPTQYFETTFGTHYGASYESSGARRTDSSGLANAYQGYNTSTWGIQKAMWGGDVNMQSVVAGSVETHAAFLWFNNQHTYWNAGGTAGFGTHAYHSASPSGGYQANRHNVHNVHFNKGEEKWTQVSTDFVAWAMDGSFRGPVMFVNSTNSEYYGYYANNALIQLRYTK